MKKILFADRIYAIDAALLVFRVTASLMILTHGWAKIANFSENLSKFRDPLGLGVATSLQMAIFAEFFCAILVGLGFMTRWALIPLIITMATVSFVVHGADFNKQELPLLYFVSFLFLFVTGPGKYSMDNQILKRNRY